MGRIRGYQSQLVDLQSKASRFTHPIAMNLMGIPDSGRFPEDPFVGLAVF